MSSSLIILLIGIFFRLYQLGSIPSSLYWDEVAMLVDAKMVQATGHDMHGNHWFQALYPSYGDYKLPVYIWLTSLFVEVLWYGEVIVRIPSAVAGVLSILVSGGVAWRVTKNKLASLATMAVLATAPWSIVFSRTGFEAHLGQLFLGLSVLVLLFANALWNKEKQITFKKFFLISIVASISVALGALATYTYFSVRFVWPVVWVAFSLFGLFQTYLKNASESATVLQNISSNNFIKTSIIFYSGLLVTGLILSQIFLIPMYQSDLYQMSNQFRLTAPSILNQYDHALDSVILRNTSLAKNNDSLFFMQNTLITEKATRVWYHRHWLLLQSFLKNLSEQLSPRFWFVSGDQNLRHGTGQHGLFVLPLFLPAFIGVYGLARKNKSLLFALLAWILAAMIPAAVPMEVPHALRSLNALIPASLIIGTGVARLIDWARQTKLQSLFGMGFGIIWIATTMQFWLYYTGPYNQASSEYWQAGYSEQALNTFAEAEKLQHQNQELILEHPDDRFFLWLLAKPYLSAAEIEELQMENYQPIKIRNIVVDPK
jgi:hypothetical protein